MDRKTKRDSGGVPVVLLAFLPLLAALWVSPSAAQAKGPSASDVPRSGPVTVRTVFPDGSPAAGAAVTVGRKGWTADGTGTVSAPSIPVASGVLSGEIRRKEGGLLGFFKKYIHYAAFLSIEPKEGVPLSATLTLSATAEIDQACRKCHPEKGGRSAVIKCAHKSGVPVKPAQAGRVAQFNKENDDLRKSGKQYYPAIVLETRKAGSGLFGEKKPFLVCASCHANHVETGQRAYVLMPFDDISVLCRGCHV